MYIKISRSERESAIHSFIRRGSLCGEHILAEIHEMKNEICAKKGYSVNENGVFTLFFVCLAWPGLAVDNKSRIIINFHFIIVLISSSHNFTFQLIYCALRPASPWLAAVTTAAAVGRGTAAAGAVHT